MSQSNQAAAAPTGKGPAKTASDIDQNFRFYDNRQKYLMFVNTCSEKWAVANRVALELKSIQPRPPAIRIFDAGVGDGTVLTRVMRTMHEDHDLVPFYVAGKEISLEDVRLTLEKMPDRFSEHPATVLVLTNMNYAAAPWMEPTTQEDAARVVWKEVALKGRSAAQFDSEITELQPWLASNWGASPNPKTGNPRYDQPVVLVIYREDCRFLMDPIIPRRGDVRADYDLVIASQPFRARASTQFKGSKVLAPLSRALAPGGRLIGIHSCGDDPALEIVQKVWPGENPFKTSGRRELLAATQEALGEEGRNFNFESFSDARSIFRYGMHTMPGEIDSDESSIGTSTLLAAWNDATYVCQIEDERIAEVMTSDVYLKATREVLKKYDGLWFNDETYVISRKRDYS
jgi:hypothetical protein